MANLNANLKLKTGLGGEYNFSIGKNYKEVFDQSQEIDNPDGFVNLLTVSKSISVSTLSGAKMLILHNTGTAAAEVQLKFQEWDDDGSGADQGNSIDTGGGATTTRYMTFLLPSREYMMFPSVRFTGYNLDASAANATSVDNIAPNSNMYVVSGGHTTEGFADDNDTTISFDDGSAGAANKLFKPNDLIRLDDEICRVTSIVDTDGDGAYTPANFIVERGVHGSTKADHTNNTAIRFPFFNTTGSFTAATGGYDTPQTDATGKFHCMNFFGYGRNLTGVADGIVPGSIAIKFYEPGYQELGLSGITHGTSTGLVAGRTYYIKVSVDGSTPEEISVTIDSANTTFGGKTGLLSKLQIALNAEFSDTTSNLFEKRCTVALIGGDIRFTSGQRLSTSAIALTAGTTGSATNEEFLAIQNGRIPALAKIETAVEGKLADDVVYDRETYDSSPNTSKFLIDNGRTQLIGSIGNGTINYETGELVLTSCPPNSHFVISATYNSAHSGGTKLTTNGHNIISQIGARCVNQKTNTSIRLLAFN